MFSAFKRLAGKGDGQGPGVSTSSAPPGHQPMSMQLQRKFAKGIQYNMKVIIKGDRNVGKTCLFNRLQGKKFIEDYIPTNEIQVTSIHWNYKATDDIVKVEVWDVVDRGKKKKQLNDKLKLATDVADNNNILDDQPALDAEFLDVYKGTNGVILMMDITKSWTFDYVQKELPKIPDHIPVIILANHCDMAHHRNVTPTQIIYFIETMQDRVAQVRYTESSMRNGFGLKLLHKFFNLPFLQLQRVTLLQQLERNKNEIDLTCQELDIYFESEDADYNKFIEQLSNRRRQQADLYSPANTIPQSFPDHPTDGTMKSSQSSPAIFIGAGHPIPSSGISQNIDIEKLSQAPKTLRPPSPPSVGGAVLAQMENSFIGKIFGKKDEIINGARELPSSSNSNDVNKLAANFNKVVSVDEFCPDGGQLDKSFLDDIEKITAVDGNVADKNVYEGIDSDSDIDNGNPLVAGYQDDFTPDEFHNISSSTLNTSTDKSMDHNMYRKCSTEETPSNLSSTTNYFQPVSNNSDSIDWMSSDSKWRRSPEGGEDISTTGQSLDFSGDSITNDDTGSIKSYNVNVSLLDSSKASHKKEKNDKDKKKDKKKTTSSTEYKAKKKHKHKKGDGKDTDTLSTNSGEAKEKSKSKKKRSRDETSDRHNTSSLNKRDELEEFLNGPHHHDVDTAYEVF